MVTFLYQILWDDSHVLLEQARNPYIASIWRLVLALWGDQPEDDERVDAYGEAVNRRLRFSGWLVQAVAPLVEKALHDGMC